MSDLPEADEVRRHHPMAGRREQRNHLAVQVGPSGLAMQAQDELPVARAFVQVVHAQNIAVPGRHGNVVRGEGMAFKLREAVIRGALGFA